MLLICQNAVMCVCAAWNRIYYVLWSKTYSIFGGLVLVPCWFATGAHISETSLIVVHHTNPTFLSHNHFSCMYLLQNYCSCNGMDVCSVMHVSLRLKSQSFLIDQCKLIYISMGLCKKDITPLLTQWSCVFLALTHRYYIYMNFWTNNKELVE